MPDSLERRVECISDRGSRLKFRVCAAGIKTWCRKHDREELTTWEELAALRASVTPPDEARVTISEHTESIYRLRDVV